jgi:hypothetical protein
MSANSRARNHEEIAALLPWYVNGTLSGEEVSAVETHLADCASCQQERQALLFLASAVKASSEALPLPSADLMERVMARVREARDSGPPREKPFRAWLMIPVFSRPGWAVAQLAISLLLAVALAVFVWRAGQYESRAAEEKQRAERAEALLIEERKRNDRYETLYGPEPQPDKQGIRLKVAFQENASEKAVRELLVSLNASLVSGPSLPGFYTLAVSIPAGADQRKAQDDALRRLRARPGVVRFAEAGE